MKKLIFIAIMLLSNLVFAGDCNVYSYTNPVNSYIPPIKSGTYYAITKHNTYSNGERILKGNGYMYSNWEDNILYKAHRISCSVTDIEPKSEYNRYLEQYESCYLLTLNCSVEEKTQFYTANVKYTDLNGYRTDGTLRWTRDEIGSTDIYCYNKTGMTIVKRVNDPQYCK